MSKCPYCKEEIDENLNACPICGELLQNSINIKFNLKSIAYALIGLIIISLLTIFIYFNIQDTLNFKNAMNNKNFKGHIIVMENLKRNLSNDMIEAIQFKLETKFGDDAYIKAHRGNKIVIYSIKEISADTIEYYLSKPVLMFKKQGYSNGKWVDTGITEKYIRKSDIGATSDGNLAIFIEFTNNGKEKFATLTKEIVGQKLAIFLNGELQSTPVIQEPILEGRAQISAGGSGFTYEQAKQMAQILQGWIDLKILDVR